MKSGLQELIERAIPLVPQEKEHDWKSVRLTGCGACGEHEGFECLNCHRCVDGQTDWNLYILILEEIRGPYF
jgi:hypothetical protein